MNWRSRRGNPAPTDTSVALFVQIGMSKRNTLYANTDLINDGDT
jgi:hypothetical protein